MIHNDKSFEYILLEGTASKFLNFGCIIDFYISRLKGEVQKFLIHNV